VSKRTSFGIGGTGEELVEDVERTLAPGLEGDSRLEGEEGEEENE
jgi:hypothetical protein